MGVVFVIRKKSCEPLVDKSSRIQKWQMFSESDRRVIEYSIAVNDYLKGTLDYYIAAPQNLLVIEAKQSDLVRGFTQLAVELIALDRWTKSTSELLYGAVTTGEDWRFGVYHRANRQVTQDQKRYQVPEDLSVLVKIIVGIISG